VVPDKAKDTQAAADVGRVYFGCPYCTFDCEGFGGVVSHVKSCRPDLPVRVLRFWRQAA
jgi:hypothetical protein